MRADEGRVVGALPPGDHVVPGINTLEDGTTGRVMRTLRKVARYHYCPAQTFRSTIIG